MHRATIWLREVRVPVSVTEDLRVTWDTTGRSVRLTYK
jgi:hypothetical protein